MAWNRLMLTTVGKTLYAKAQQGKQLIFTRVGIGDGDLGTGSLVNRTALISEKKSLLIDAIQIVNETESAIITTLSNADITAGFYFREIGIFAKDPDTQIEQLYLYDNAGADGEYIPDNQSGVTVAERLKFLLMLENVATVSFVASGNPIYLTPEDIDDTCTAVGTLWSSSKTKMEINAAESAAKAASRPITWTPSAADVGAIPATAKGAASGVAELDEAGKVPAAQLPSYVDDVLERASQSAFPASGESGKIYVALDTNKTYRWSGSAYVEISQSVALGETSATAYRGDRGKTAYDHSQATGNPHGLTAATIGAIPTSAKGAANGVAPLNERSHVPSSMLYSDTVEYTSSRMLSVTDAGCVIMAACNTPAEMVLTVPTHANSPIVVGAEIEIVKMGTGKVSIAFQSGVTVFCCKGTYEIAEQYTSVCLKKLNSNIWLLQGSLL